MEFENDNRTRLLESLKVVGLMDPTTYFKNLGKRFHGFEYYSKSGKL